MWHSSSGWSKLLINDMDTMASDETSTYLEKFLNDQDKYIWQNKESNKVHIVTLDPADVSDFQKTLIAFIQDSNSNHSFFNTWGFVEIINAPRGGFLLGWKIKDISGQDQYIRDARVLTNNDGAKSSIAAESLPQSVVDSVSVFTTKARRNFKMYLEKHLATTNVSLVTYFAPKK